MKLYIVANRLYQFNHDSILIALPIKSIDTDGSAALKAEENELYF